MNLELKHLSPYLPYGLKVRSKQEITYILNTFSNMRGKGLENRDIYSCLDNQYKPILRPLSDLTKDLSIGNDIVNFQTQFNQYDFEWLITSNNKRKLINSLEYFIVTKLFEWHFDVFGLIEQGLAIDINTL